MKTIFLRVVLIGLVGAGFSRNAVAAPAAKPVGQDDVLLRCHFVGMDQLLAGSSAAKLKQIWSLPATADVRKQAFDRLARVPFQAVSNQVAKGAPDQAALFRPLWDDLLPAESFLEWRGPANQPTEFVFCLQLPDNRAQVWSQNLRQALDGWKLGTVSAAKSEAGDGWVFKHRDGTSAMAYTRAGRWVVVGLGSATLRLHAEVLQKIKAGGRPVAQASGAWLEADANLARLRPWLPPLAPYRDLPSAHLSLSNRADVVRTVMRLRYAGPHGWKSEPWAIPTTLIRDPLISFTAMQGLAPLLKPLKFFQSLKLEPEPNQAVAWAQAQFPFLTEVAVPLRNAGPQLVRITPLLPSLVLSNRAQPLPGSIFWATNTQSLVWQGLPVAVPQLAAVKGPKGEYLLGTLFPSMRSTNAPPPALFRQVEGRTDLVYYDWEITEPRLKQWRTLYQLVDVVSKSVFAGDAMPTQRWLAGVAPFLGNTSTEITTTSPTEFTLVRNSHCGLTGFELVSLMRWLDSPEFPKFSLAGQSRVIPDRLKSKPGPPQTGKAPKR